MATPLTPDFHDRLAEARDVWFRSRFRLYYRILVVAALAGAAALAIQGLTARDSTMQRIFGFGAGFSLLSAIVSAFPLAQVARRPPVSKRALLWTSYIVTSVLALALLVPAVALGELITVVYRARYPTANIGPMIPWAICFVCIHSLAALILAWSPRQAFLAYGIFAAFTTPLIALFATDPLPFKLRGIATVWVVGLPGVLIAAINQLAFVRNFRIRALGEHVVETQQELTDARRLHDALFPAQLLEGPLTLRYAYEPMRSIGGDFLYTHQDPAAPNAALSLALIDVTGHGVPAALTVHRLHGELERLFGERPDADPGHILDRLNSYLHHALAKHSVYATAICCRLTAAPGRRATLEFASAGHPPAFRRDASGALAPLDSTAFVLGAVPPGAFEAAPISLELAPGDSVLLYTDGATESRNASGAMLRVDGLAAMLASLPIATPDAPAALMQLLTKRRYGPPSDDTLVVELAFRPA